MPPPLGAEASTKSEQCNFVRFFMLVACEESDSRMIQSLLVR